MGSFRVKKWLLLLAAVAGLPVVANPASADDNTGIVGLGLLTACGASTPAQGGYSPDGPVAGAGDGPTGFVVAGPGGLTGSAVCGGLTFEVDSFTVHAFDCEAGVLEMEAIANGVSFLFSTEQGVCQPIPFPGVEFEENAIIPESSCTLGVYTDLIYEGGVNAGVRQEGACQGGVPCDLGLGQLISDQALVEGKPTECSVSGKEPLCIFMNYKVLESANDPSGGSSAGTEDSFDFLYVVETVLGVPSNPPMGAGNDTSVADDHGELENESGVSMDCKSWAPSEFCFATSWLCLPNVYYAEFEISAALLQRAYDPDCGWGGEGPSCNEWLVADADVTPMRIPLVITWNPAPPPVTVVP